MEISASFRNHLSQVLDRGRLIHVQAVTGGDINACFRMDFSDGDSAFVKLNKNQPANFFAAEAEGLQALQNSQSLTTPAVLIVDEWESHQYLVLEFIDIGRPTKDYSQILGKGLARLHGNSHKLFGWAQDNYIGSLLQSNAWSSSWTDFYAEYRILKQTKVAFDAGLLHRKDQQAIERFLNALNELIPQENPALLHGDLWSGNVMVNQLGRPIWIDPSVYYGHREMDLAMMKLFGGFSEEVFSIYHSELPLEPAWQERIAYHQLYPLMVHLNLFGSSYLSACRLIWQKFA